MSLKPQVEAIIYAAEEPVTIEQIAAALKAAAVPEIGTSEDRNIGSSDTGSDVANDVRNSEAAETNAVAEATPQKSKKPDPLAALKSQIRAAVEELTAEYANAE